MPIVRVVDMRQAVRKGESILELDAKPFIWAVEGAENELATARANLKKAEADAELDRFQFDSRENGHEA